MSLLERLQAWMGLEASPEGFAFLALAEERFFSASLLPIFPPGLLDLAGEDRNQFFFLEVNAELGSNFLLDADGQFACWSGDEGWPKVLLQCVGEGPWPLFAWGEAKARQRWVKALESSRWLQACRLDHAALLRVGNSLNLEEFHYLKEQPGQQGELGFSLRGQAKGSLAAELLSLLAANQGDALNLTSVRGRLQAGGLGRLRVISEGWIFGEGLRLREFYEVVKPLHQAMRQEVQALVEAFCSFEPQGRSLQVKGEGWVFSFPRPMYRLDALVKAMTSGQGPLKLFGNFQRMGRDLWRVLCVDLRRGWELEIELTSTELRIFPQGTGGLALAFRLEKYLARQILGWRQNV